MSMSKQQANIARQKEAAIQLLWQGQIDRAKALFEQLCKLDQSDPILWNALGEIHSFTGVWQKALPCWSEALKLQPTDNYVRFNLAITLQNLDRLSESEVLHRQILQSDHKHRNAATGLACTLFVSGQLDESIQVLRQLLSLYPDHVNAHSNLLFYLNHSEGVDQAQLHGAHDEWNHLHADKLRRDDDFTNSADPDRQLKIGYVSPDFRTHSVAYFMEPLLANHNTTNVRVFCYSSVKQDDATTQRLRSYRCEWRDIRTLSDEALYDKVREDGIDILIDLSGHTADHRLLMFARKPAPVQATYLGYPCTTGMSAMDYRITDVHVEPPGSPAANHVETPVYLPGGFLCYRPPPVTPDIEQPPVLQSSTITFGSFNKLAKLTPSMVALWASIITAVPDSRLLLKTQALKDAQGRARLMAQFEDCGIDPARIELIGNIPSNREHLALYNKIDIALDTSPYNGVTTSCEALWMGVPVITLAGDSPAGRHGQSLLMQINMPEFIAHSRNEYRRIAVALAGNTTRLKELRTTLRTQLNQSLLRDEKTFAKNMENTYREMWKSWCWQQASNL